MGVVRTGGTEQDQELHKWEKPYRYEPFPAMLYRGILKANGKHEYETLTVQSAAEKHRRVQDGWVESPVDALAAVETQEQQLALAAAENAAAATRMTGKARRELQAREAATHRHVGE